MNTTDNTAVDPSALPEVELTEQALLGAAQAQTGLSDFGGALYGGSDADWQEGFTLLLKGLNEEADLSAVGRLMAYGEVLRHLVNRLRVTEDIKNNPSILEVEIRKPLFVVGLPRTGSTILHDLLAQDQNNRVPMTWECHHMSPPPEADSYHNDPRIAECEAHFEQGSRQMIPEFQAIHEMGAELAQECVMLNAFDFKSLVFSNQFHVPTYQRWVESTDLTSVYRTHKVQLQYMQWHNPRQRWVLKSVSHLWGLDAIYKIYPDAQVIMTHRDPLKLIASHCSLVTMACSMGCDSIDPIEIAKFWTVSWMDAMNKGVDFRNSDRPEAKAVFDMHFSELIKDQVAMAQRIYDHFGLELTEETKLRMQDFIDNNPKDRHGTHSYTLEQFGLDLETERERYRFYQDYFNVAAEM